MNGLFGAVLGYVNVARGQRVGEIVSRLGDVPQGPYGALVQKPEVVVGITGVVAVVMVTSTDVILGTAKAIVAVEVEAAPMVSSLIRRAPWAEAVVCSSGRPVATVDVAINGRAAFARGATAPIAPLLRRREARVDHVGIVCSEMTLIENAASVLVVVPRSKLKVEVVYCRALGFFA